MERISWVLSHLWSLLSSLPVLSCNLQDINQSETSIINLCVVSTNQRQVFYWFNQSQLTSKIYIFITIIFLTTYCWVVDTRQNKSSQCLLGQHIPCSSCQVSLQPIIVNFLEINFKIDSPQDICSCDQSGLVPECCDLTTFASDSQQQQMCHHPPATNQKLVLFQPIRCEYLPSWTNHIHQSDSHTRRWKLSWFYPTDPESTNQKLELFGVNQSEIRIEFHQPVRDEYISPVVPPQLLVAWLPPAARPPPCSWRSACRSGCPRCSSRELPANIRIEININHDQSTNQSTELTNTLNMTYKTTLKGTVEYKITCFLRLSSHLGVMVAGSS